MPSIGGYDTEIVSIDDLESGARFHWHGRWYQWEMLPRSQRMMARYLDPNQPTGEVRVSGHSMLPGTKVEMLSRSTAVESNPGKHFDDFGVELDAHPIGAGLPRSTGS
jgi:hypothetical protein